MNDRDEAAARLVQGRLERTTLGQVRGRARRLAPLIICMLLNAAATLQACLGMYFQIQQVHLQHTALTHTHTHYALTKRPGREARVHPAEPSARRRPQGRALQRGGRLHRGGARHGAAAGEVLNMHAGAFPRFLCLLLCCRIVIEVRFLVTVLPHCYQSALQSNSLAYLGHTLPHTETPPQKLHLLVDNASVAYSISNTPRIKVGGAPAACCRLPSNLQLPG